MSKTPYELHLEAQKKYANENQEIIRMVCSNNPFEGTPQHILWMKTVCNKLEDGGEHRTFRHPDGTFGFTEKLVNRLMHLVYLKTRREFDETSYRKGWEDCIESAIKAVENL